MNAAVQERTLGLGEILAWLEDDGLVAPDVVAPFRALAERGAYRDQHPLAVIAERGWADRRGGGKLSEESLSVWLAKRVGLPYYRIDPLKVDVGSITAVMSYAYASRFNVLPVKVEGDVVTVATAEPFQREWEDELGRIQNCRFERVFANPEDIRRYRVEFYSISQSMFGAERANTERTGTGIQSLEQLVDLGRSGKLDANDQHIVNIVDWLFQYAFEQRASDIHLEPRRDQALVRFRIDGVLHQVYQIPAGVMAPIASRLKILARMDIAEKRRPQDGRIKTRNADGQEIELRVSSMPTAFGEKLVMRIFDPVVLLKNFAELGFDAEDEQRWRTMTAQPNGIILVTGPTGSGKTTTLYSTLRTLARPEVNVCTVEDPIELVEPSFNQMQVHAGIGLDFAAGVRTLMRQDPDIIMVGEIRDTETAEMAVQAALTGHLVLSTLHTNDAPTAATRLLDLGVPPFLMSSTVLGVIAQRLVRTLCPHCKAEAESDETAWANLVAPYKGRRPKTMYRAVGCLECRNTGYKGRVAIYEMLEFTPAIRGLIAPDISAAHLRRQGLKDGMRPLRLRGAQKVADGLTTAEEVLRVAPPVAD